MGSPGPERTISGRSHVKKFGLLNYSTTSNVGDEIQSLAARRFLPSVDRLIDRDNLSETSGSEEISVIMNGWYLHPGRHNQFHWPPPPNINPLFISFHAGRTNVLGHRQFHAYYKLHEPIGCRDLSTLRMFTAIGIKAYFSGCLTLTLQNSSDRKSGQVVFSDPFGHVDEYRFPMPGDPGFDNELWSKVPADVRDSAVFVSHAVDKAMDTHERFSRAEELLKLYGSAKLVITSRLHCALPCLAFGTPVLYLGYEKVIGDRFGGLLQLMNCSDTRKVRADGFHIDFQNPPPPPNPAMIENISRQLAATCEQFVNE